MAAPSKRTTHWGIALKLGLFVLVGTTLIWAPGFLYHVTSSRRLLLQNVEESTRALSSAAVAHIESVFDGLQNTPTALALTLERRPPSKEHLVDLIRAGVDSNPNVYGSTVAYEASAAQPGVEYFAPYWYRKNGAMTLTWLGGSDYQYHTLDWYIIPKELGHPLWSEPFYDEGGGNILMTTYSVPFFREAESKRVFQGVVTFDVPLDWLIHIVSSLSLMKSGSAFLVSQNGVFVAHAQKELVMKEGIFSLAEVRHDTELRRIGRAMIGGGRGFVRINGLEKQQPSWLYYEPLPRLKWSLGVVYPESALFKDVSDLNETVLFLGAGGFVGLFLVIVIISATMTRPIRLLARTTLEIARGNLDITLPAVKARDEVGDLSRSFENMRVALKEYIANLTETTAAKERIESELKIAHTIQMSFLPKRFPPFPEKDEFDIYAYLEPAREVGGDLYDFFLIDDEHLFFTVGDVSGKGVGAALFMAVTKTLLKGIAMQGLLDPAAVLTRVNTELVKDNDAMMFVTVFCAVYEFRTGHLVYASAGHNPPVLLSPAGIPRFLNVTPQFVLGTMEDTVYEVERIDLAAGDTLIVYTDGVTEAEGPGEEFFSNERLLAALAGTASESPQEQVSGLFRSVHGFAGGLPQNDDITALALRCRRLSADT